MAFNTMALDGIEIIAIGAIAVVMFLWGPAKIPELARALGRAKREFDMASREFSSMTTQLTQTAEVQVAPQKSADEILLDTARQLGITTDGKTREQISQEIIVKSSGGHEGKSGPSDGAV